MNSKDIETKQKFLETSIKMRDELKERILELNRISEDYLDKYNRVLETGLFCIYSLYMLTVCLIHLICFT